MRSKPFKKETDIGVSTRGEAVRIRLTAITRDKHYMPLINEWWVRQGNSPLSTKERQKMRYAISGYATPKDLPLIEKLEKCAAWHESIRAGK